MSLEELKLAETWEYIQGGFLFLDESGNALAEVNGELKHYINTLSSVQSAAGALIERLHLTDPERSYDEIPESLKRILKQDIAYIKEEPSNLDESFASIALTAFYRRVSDYLHVPSDLPDHMKTYVMQEVQAQLPSCSVIW